MKVTLVNTLSSRNDGISPKLADYKWTITLCYNSHKCKRIRSVFMQIHFLRHTTFILTGDNFSMLVDPMLSPAEAVENRKGK
jgi:hypothetical protein